MHTTYKYFIVSILPFRMFIICTENNTSIVYFFPYTCVSQTEVNIPLGSVTKCLCVHKAKDKQNLPSSNTNFTWGFEETGNLT